jgi:hypothetical protein
MPLNNLYSLLRISAVLDMTDAVSVGMLATLPSSWLALSGAKPSGRSRASQTTLCISAASTTAVSEPCVPSQQPMNSRCPGPPEFGPHISRAATVWQLADSKGTVRTCCYGRELSPIACPRVFFNAERHGLGEDRLNFVMALRSE